MSGLMKVNANPMLQLDEDNISPVSVPAGQVRQLTVKSNSCSTSNLSFRYELSGKELLDSTWLVVCNDVFKITVTGKNNDKAINRDTLSLLSLAPWSLFRCCNNLNVSINGLTSSVNPSETIDAMNLFLPEDYHSQLGSMGPTLNNSTFSVQDMANEIVQGKRISPDNPFLSGEKSRFVPSRINYKTPASGGVKEVIEIFYSLCLPIPHPFLTWTSANSEKKTLKNVRHISVDMQFFGNLDPCFLYHNTLLPTDVDDGHCTIAVDKTEFKDANVSLQLGTYLPLENVPMTVSHPYVRQETRQYKQSLASYGSSSYVQTGSIVLNEVPSKILIYGKPEQSSYVTNSNKPEYYLNINSVSIDTPSNTGMLATATEYQLYQMSQRNGYRCSYNQYHRTLGSHVLIDTIQDLSGLIPGTQTNLSMNFKLGVKNISTESLLNPSNVTGLPDFYVYIVFFFENSKIIISENMAVLNTAISSSDVQKLLTETRDIKAMPLDMAVGNKSVSSGGSFLSTMGKIARGAVKTARYLGLIDPIKQFGRESANAVVNSVLARNPGFQPPMLAQPDQQGAGVRVF